jgi:hypothetical protein
MKKIIIDNKSYFTNIDDITKIQKCIDFYKTGCTNYAISFDNIPKDVINETTCKGSKIKLLRRMNFSDCFMPAHVAMENYSEDVLKKGIDLIELI